MIHRILTDNEIKQLNKLIGNNLISIKSQKPDVLNKVFGNILLIIDNELVEIRNEYEPTPFYEDNEDISTFKVKTISSISSFEPMIVDDYIDTVVNEIIEQFIIVRDTINVKDKSGDVFYTIETDTAIVIKTSHSFYVFSRDWCLEEEMVFVKTIDYKKDLYPIDSIINDWSDEENGFVAVCKREELLLK